MKKLNIILLLVMGMLLTVSCDSDRDSNPVLEDPTIFVLNIPAYASTMYDLKHSETVELTCSQPNYGFTAATDYVVQISLTGDFKEAVDEDTPATYQSLSTVYNTARMNVSAQEMAVAIVNLSGITEEENFYTDPIKVYVRLKASVGEGMKPIISNVIELPQVLTYFALDPMVMPDNMYLIGSISEWDWAKAFTMITVYPAKSGEFWTIQYLGADAEIKFNTDKSWNGTDFGFANTVITDNANAGVSDKDGNIKIANAGWYILVVKTTIVGRDYTYAVDIYQPNVYVCGPTVGDKWGADGKLFEVPATADGDFVSPVLASGGDLRLCIVLPGHEWWNTEFLFYEGKIAYRGGETDQPRVAVDGGKKVYLNFHEGTGRVE